jgi:hypothetical protein
MNCDQQQQVTNTTDIQTTIPLSQRYYFVRSALSDYLGSQQLYFTQALLGTVDRWILPESKDTTAYIEVTDLITVGIKKRIVEECVRDFNVLDPSSRYKSSTIEVNKGYPIKVSPLIALFLALHEIRHIPQLEVKSRLSNEVLLPEIVEKLSKGNRPMARIVNICMDMKIHQDILKLPLIKEGFDQCEALIKEYHIEEEKKRLADLISQAKGVVNETLIGALDSHFKEMEAKVRSSKPSAVLELFDKFFPKQESNGSFSGDEDCEEDYERMSWAELVNVAYLRKKQEHEKQKKEQESKKKQDEKQQQQQKKGQEKDEKGQEQESEEGQEKEREKGQDSCGEGGDSKEGRESNSNSSSPSKDGGKRKRYNRNKLFDEEEEGEGGDGDDGDDDGSEMEGRLDEHRWGDGDENDEGSGGAGESEEGEGDLKLRRQRRIDQAMREAVYAGKQMAGKMAGCHAGDMAIFVKETDSPNKKLIQMLSKIRSKVKTLSDKPAYELSWRVTRSRGGFYLPTERESQGKKKRPAVVLVLDTSGSMWDEETLTASVSVGRGLMKSGKLAAMYQCDTEISRCDNQLSSPSGKGSGKVQITGGGGTDLSPRHIKQIREDLASSSKGKRRRGGNTSYLSSSNTALLDIVYVTDGYVDLSELQADPNVRLHIVINNSGDLELRT